MLLTARLLPLLLLIRYAIMKKQPLIIPEMPQHRAHTLGILVAVLLLREADKVLIPFTGLQGALTLSH